MLVDGRSRGNDSRNRDTSGTTSRFRLRHIRHGNRDRLRLRPGHGPRDLPFFVQRLSGRARLSRSLPVLNHGDGDIVFSATIPGQFDQDIGRRLSQLSTKYLGDLGILNMPGQPVGTEQQLIARLQIDLEQINRGSLFGANAVEDDVLVGVARRFFLGQGSLFNQTGHQALVARNLLQLSASPAIGPAVAYIGDVSMPVANDRRNHRSCHATALFAPGGQLSKIGVGRLHGFQKARAQVLMLGELEIVVQRSFAGVLAGDLTCVGATDTICDDIETAVEPAISGCFGFIGGDEVLVMASHYPGICTPCGR